MGSAETLITMGNLMEYDNWQWFAHQAFPYNNGNLSINIDEK